jgi:hypothetical protein
MLGKKKTIVHSPETAEVDSLVRNRLKAYILWSAENTI